MGAANETLFVAPGSRSSESDQLLRGQRHAGRHVPFRRLYDGLRFVTTAQPKK